MTIHLTPELESLIQGRIRSGDYPSANDVIEEALQALAERDEDHASKLRRVKMKIDQGLTELDRGEGIDGEPFMQNLIDSVDTPTPNARPG